MFRRVVAAALCGVLSALALTGCSFMSGVQYGPDERPAIANGVDAEVGTVEFRSFIVISTEEGAPGRFLGSLFNHANEPVTVTIADENEEVTVTVPADGAHHFSDVPAGLDTVSEIPGARVQLKVTVGSDTEDILPIVLDGSLEQYAQYVVPFESEKG